MARYLVTGAAGFIGSALANRLIAEGHAVVVVDNLSTGFLANVPSNAEFVEGDLARPETIARIPKGPYAAVLHLAAQSSGAIGQKDPFGDMQSNIGSTIQLICWCRERNVSRFLYASSMTVYGHGNCEPVDEDTPAAPISYYGVGKLASEHYLRIATMGGLQPTILRLYNVYGPGQNLGNLQQGMASIYLAYLLAGEDVPVTGSLNRYRDLCYVDDVVDAFVRALAASRTLSPAYNIGSGRKTTVRDLLERLITAMALPPDHPVQELAGSPSDIFGSVAKIDRAERELGWTPQIDLETGLQKMVSWARAISRR